MKHLAIALVVLCLAACGGGGSDTEEVRPLLADEKCGTGLTEHGCPVEHIHHMGGPPPVRAEL